MPESLVVSAIFRELMNPPPVVLSRSKNKSYEETGRVVIHTACCAQLDGNRQTVTLHQCLQNDPLFLQLVSTAPKKTHHKISKSTKTPDPQGCPSCAKVSYPEPLDSSANEVIASPNVLNASSIQAKISHLGGTSAADIVNALEIEGKILAAARGKELVVAIGQMLIRICFSLEGHGLWIPTPVYRDIVSRDPVRRGVKSSSFIIPDAYWDGCPSVQGQISILAAIICSDWTFVLVDHNVMLTLHVMILRAPCTKDDLQPGSKLWPAIWSVSHGPSLILERPLAEDGLERWRLLQLRDRDDTPIFLSVKNNQMVFNGYGAQETCDMLFEALLSPCMPTFAICEDSQLWNRFRTAIFDCQETHVDLVNSKPSILPFVSGRRPFRFDRNGHNRFLMHVSTYRRRHVKVDQDQLVKLNDCNLLNPNAILQNDGTAAVTENGEPFNLTTIRPGCEHSVLQNYRIVMPAGRHSMKTIKVYSPIRAKPNPSWWAIESSEPCEKDVKDDCNQTTLGPYSFHAFVQAAWTKTKVKGRNLKETDLNGNALRGRRKELDVGPGRRKRPRTADIEKTCQDNRKAKRAKKENTFVTHETRTLRSGRKLK